MLPVPAEFPCELIVVNTMGLAPARGCGREGGQRPSPTGDQAAPALQVYDAREKTVQQIAGLVGPRSAVYGVLVGVAVAVAPLDTGVMVHFWVDPLVQAPMTASVPAAVWA